VASGAYCSMSTRTALVTGASSGIGEQTALALQGAGFSVYAAARRVERMQHLAADGVRILAMDVTDHESMAAGIEQIDAEAGGVDVLVNNAGYGSYGAIEDVPMDEARAQFEVNVFGAAELVRMVLPHMRSKRAGTIVNISSMGGKITTPLGGWYHATKFALEALSDCLRLELAPFGIDVVVIEPGSIDTEWGQIAADKLRASSGSGPYAAQASAMARALSRGGEHKSPPSVVADAVLRAVNASRPRTRYPVGANAKMAVVLRAALPDRAFDSAIRRMTGAPRR
jgi:NAD(P)-dependent dehydrogenase (short-subunit alcohol dehydrogenase family)